LHGELDGPAATVRALPTPIQDVLTMPSTANAATVAGRLRHNGELRVLPVVASGRLVGVVTRGDLLRRTLPGAPAQRRRGLFGLFGFRAADDGVDWATLISLVVFVGVALFTTPRPDRPAPAGTVPIRAGEV
jgi:CBS domain-containing protein